jgi:hypothetical protein
VGLVRRARPALCGGVGAEAVPRGPQARVLPVKWRAAALAAHGPTELAGKSVLSIADWKRRAGDYS